MLMIVLGLGAIFVWRSSSPKKHGRGCNCGCEHENHDETGKDKAPR